MYDKHLFDRLEARVEKIPEAGCWIWTGFAFLNRPHPGNRYGGTAVKAGTGGKRSGWRHMTTHRAMMWAIHGPLREDQCVCHRCDVPLCINPAHLFIGSMKDNIWDSKRKGRHFESEKTHCDHGHPLSGDNLTYSKQSAKNGGWHRACKTCHRARHRIKAGWPAELAYALPAGRTGERPAELPRKHSGGGWAVINRRRAEANRGAGNGGADG